MSVVIETRGLSKVFHAGEPPTRWLRGLGPHQSPEPGGRTAVDGVNLQVKEGEIFGLLGPNGAGKTTLIKMLCTLLSPTSGKAAVCGADIVEQGRAVREMIGLVASDERSFYWRMTGRQNLRFFAAIHQLFGREADLKIEALADALDLRTVLDRRFDGYSTGMRQRLAIARGLLKEPRVLFMDEPTKGVDPLNAQALLSLIRERVSGAFGKTVLITTHILSEAEQVCDRVAILHQGKVLACGTVAEICRSTRREERYGLWITGVADSFLQDLRRIDGVIRCHSRGESDGMRLVEVVVDRERHAFPDVIDLIVRRKGRLHRCTSEEVSFDEVFRNLFLRHREGRDA